MAETAALVYRIFKEVKRNIVYERVRLLEHIQGHYTAQRLCIKCVVWCGVCVCVCVCGVRSHIKLKILFACMSDSVEAAVLLSPTPQPSLLSVKK
jgi:hypothetical protein